MRELAGRVAVVTGAASGIGSGIVHGCVDADMHVVMVDVQEGVLEDAAGQLREAGASVDTRTVDVADAAAVDALADAVYAAYGDVALLCNNAGVMGASFGNPAWIAELGDWHWALGVNLWGVIHGVTSFVPRMIEQGRPAHVVNTSSMAALSYVPFAGAYTVSKHAVLGFTEQLALDLRALDVPIGVTALCPSGTRGNMQANSAVLRPSSLPPSVETNTKREYLKAVTSTVNHALTDPDDVGRLVIDAVRDDTLYVLTHESAPERIQVRFDCILSGAQPPVTTAPPRLGRSGSR